MLTGPDLEVESGLHWLRLLLTPSLVFWVGGAAIIIGASPGGLRGLESWLVARPTFIQGALAIGVVLLVLISGVVAARITDPILRVLEGYWGNRFGRIRQLLVKRLAVNGKAEKRWQALQTRLPRLTPTEARELAELDGRLRRIPPTGRLMPTRLGNILAASETWPQTKYGMDPAVCWPRLWLVLPDKARETMTEARGKLDSAAAGMCWAAAFIVWTPWAWWAAPAGILTALALYRYWVLRAAERFGDALEACFDVHHRDLYVALHWPEPNGTAQDRLLGAKLTQFLWRGEIDDLSVAPTGGEPARPVPESHPITSPESPARAAQ